MVVEELELLFAAGDVDDLVDGVGGEAFGLDFHAHRVAHPHGRKVHHRLVERGGIEHRAAMVAIRQAVDDGADVGDKAHVEHPVGLVDHQRIHLTQVHDVAAHVILQAPGRGHQQIHRGLLELAPLAIVIHPAIDREGTHIPAILTQRLGILANLDDQLTRWGQDEGARGARLQVALLGGVQIAREHGNQEGRRLAGTRLGAPGYILPRQGELERLRLNRRAILKTQVGHRVQNLARQPKVHKALLALRLGHLITRRIPRGMGLGKGFALLGGKGPPRAALACRRVAHIAFTARPLPTLAAGMIPALTPIPARLPLAFRTLAALTLTAFPPLGRPLGRAFRCFARAGRARPARRLTLLASARLTIAIGRMLRLPPAIAGRLRGLSKPERGLDLGKETHTLESSYNKKLTPGLGGHMPPETPR